MPTVRRFTLRTRIALLVFASTGLALLCSSALLFLQLRQSHNYTLLERMRFAGTAYSQRIENVLKGENVMPKRWPCCSTPSASPI